MLAIYCWGLGLSYVVCIPRETPLERTNFTFTNNCQLETVSGLGMGIHVDFPSRCWNHIWLGLVQALWMLPWSPWVGMCVSTVVSGWSSFFFGALTTFLPLFHLHLPFMLPTSCPFYFIIESNLCCSCIYIRIHTHMYRCIIHYTYMYRCMSTYICTDIHTPVWAIHWSMADLSGITSLKKPDP